MYAIQIIDTKRNKVINMTGFKYETLNDALEYKQEIMIFHDMSEEQILVVKKGFVFESEEEYKKIQEANK